MSASPWMERWITESDSPLQDIMKKVMVALAPATAFGLFLFGWPALFLFVVTLISALFFEAVCLQIAGKPIKSALRDGSALLTGWLLVLSLPPWAPWWIGFLGAGFAIVIGKQVYGGLGQNLFNPAMLARVALLISFPLEMTTWPRPLPVFFPEAPDLFKGMALIFGGALPADGTTGATMIGFVKTEFTQGQPLSHSLNVSDYDFFKAFVGWSSGSLGESSGLLLLIGGLSLIRKKIITWHIPLSVIGTVILLATIMTLVDGERYPGPLFHLSSGALFLCAFFIATDYVTCPSYPRGQLIYGAGIGVLIYVIRTWGAYPEGVGFAVLLMNGATPLIDHYIRPRIYGRDHKGKPLTMRGDKV